MIRELDDGITLHSNVNSSPDYQLIWRHLEKAAEHNYVSSYLIEWLVETKRRGHLKMSENMEKILANFMTEREIETRNEKASYKFPCCRSRCEIRFNEELAIITCRQCISVMS
jgi:hypothetical protein